MAKVEYHGSGLPEWARNALVEILDNCGIPFCKVTSGRRTIQDQARVMYELIESIGVIKARRLYKLPGRKVIKTYVETKAMGYPKDLILAEMGLKISLLGAEKVSAHCTADPKKVVFDVAPSSVPKDEHRHFERAVRSHKLFHKMLTPPVDPVAFHIEFLNEGV